MATSLTTKPSTLAELRSSGWHSKSVKQEIHDNFLAKLQAGEDLYPGIIGYDDTVLPELNIAILAQHDLLFLGEKGQAKSRLMRLMVSFLHEEIPYIDDAQIPVHDDPFRPITKRGRQLVTSVPADEVPIAWWHRDDRYAERLSPGTKFADIIGEI
ncbi:MAG: magnesium chelatase, partial [Pirellulales bacterium]